MAKNHDGGPAGSRTERPHAADGWQEGGRKADPSKYSQDEADRRAARHASIPAQRPAGYVGKHRG